MTRYDTDAVVQSPRSDDSSSYAVERWLVYGGALVSMTGVQLVVPALPQLQDALSLDDATIALFTSVYLLPSMATALVVGVLAERYGRRRVFGISLLIFGVAGGLVALATALGELLPLLAFRFVQGIGFAGLGPLTITAVGDLFGGPAQVTVQGRRSVAMQIGDAAFPVAGGLLILGSFTWPFLGAVVALPLGFAVLRWYPRGTRAAEPPTPRESLRALGGFARRPRLLALQLSGFTRFLLKFIVLAYLPVLAVNQGGASAATVGVALGAAALAGGVAALLARRLLDWLRVSQLLAASLVMLALSMSLMPFASEVVVLLLLLAVYGFGDGLYGVLQNSLVAEAVPGPRRATFVSATAAARNLGKFVAPTLAGVIALFASVRASFLVAACCSVAALVLVLPLRHFDGQFSR